MRNIALYFFLLCQFFVNSQTIKIVIDPGHGGSDPGNISKNTNDQTEKNLNLAIAKKVGVYLENKLQNVKVVYTRNDDSFPSLDDRVNKANTEKADLFISIHCNHSANSKVHGTETHVNDLKSKNSVKLAKLIESEFKNKAGRKSRGVKTTNDREKSLQVLKFTQMTSVLVECGFMSNPTEVAFLQTSNGQDLIASAIFRACRSHLKEAFPKIEFIKKEKKEEQLNSDLSSNESDSNIFTVQIMSSKTWMDTEKGEFLKLEKAVERKQISNSGYKYCYTSGVFSTKEEAKAYCKKVQKLGFKDAIIITK